MCACAVRVGREYPLLLKNPFILLCSISMVFLTRAATQLAVPESQPHQPDLVKMSSPSKGSSKPSQMNDFRIPHLGLKNLCASLLGLDFDSVPWPPRQTQDFGIATGTFPWGRRWTAEST